jgi:putative transposase
MIATGVDELAPVTGTRGACAALAIPRASHYRRSRGPSHGPRRPRPAPPRTLSEPERSAVLDELHAPRFLDASPAAVYATLLDEGTYLASERTMYRILAANAEVRERRDQLRHPAYARPELLATGPRELWSWDIERHEVLTNPGVPQLERERVPMTRVARAGGIDQPAAAGAACGVATRT